MVGMAALPRTASAKSPSVVVERSAPEHAALLRLLPCAALAPEPIRDQRLPLTGSWLKPRYFTGWTQLRPCPDRGWSTCRLPRETSRGVRVKTNCSLSKCVRKPCPATASMWRSTRSPTCSRATPTCSPIEPLPRLSSSRAAQTRQWADTRSPERWHRQLAAWRRLDVSTPRDLRSAIFVGEFAGVHALFRRCAFGYAVPAGCSASLADLADIAGRFPGATIVVGLPLADWSALESGAVAAPALAELARGGPREGVGVGLLQTAGRVVVVVVVAKDASAVAQLQPRIRDLDLSVAVGRAFSRCAGMETGPSPPRATTKGPVQTCKGCCVVTGSSAASIPRRHGRVAVHRANDLSIQHFALQGPVCGHLRSRRCRPGRTGPSGRCAAPVLDQRYWLA